MEPQGYGPDQHAAVAKEARSDSVGKLDVVTTVKVGEEGRGGGGGGGGVRVGEGGVGGGGLVNVSMHIYQCTHMARLLWSECQDFLLFLTLSYS